MARKIDKGLVRRALELRGEGKTAEQIADELGRKPRTIQNYVSPKWLARNGLEDLYNTQAGLRYAQNAPSTSVFRITWRRLQVGWMVWLMGGGVVAFTVSLILLITNGAWPYGSGMSPGSSKAGERGAPFAESRVPSQLPPPTPSATETEPALVKLDLDDRVAVTSAGNGATVHTSPSMDALKVEPAGIPAGYEGKVVGGPKLSDGFNWWRIQWVTGVIGWTREAAGDGTAWLQPLPGKGVFPEVSDVGISYHVQVYEDSGPIGLAVRDAPGTDQPINARKHAGAQGMTVGSPKKDGTIIWWRVVWDDGTFGWSADSQLSSGVYLLMKTL